MEKIIKFKEIVSKNKKLIKEINSGKIIIYPTDTGYCIGCIISKKKNIEKIKKLTKHKDNQNISIIAPSKKWVYDNFKIKNKNYIKKFPGPFTFIMKTKKINLFKNFNLENKEIGIKIPDHKFHNLIKKIGTPILSIELKNKFNFNIISIDQINKGIIKNTDIIIDDNFIKKSPSSVINLNKEIPSIIG